MRHALRVSALSALIFAVSATAQTPQKPWPIRAVIIVTFEVSNDTGDIPGGWPIHMQRFISAWVGSHECTCQQARFGILAPHPSSKKPLDEWATRSL